MLSRSSLAVLVLLGGFWSAACGHKTKVRPPVAPPTKPTAASTRPATQIPPIVPPPATATKGPERTALPATPSPAPTVRGPSIRIGLTIPPEELSISSAGEFILVEKTPEAPRLSLSAPVQIRLERTQTETGEIYRVQVASLASKASAEKLGKQLSEQFGMPAVVRENLATSTNQVRLGSFVDRNQAQAFATGPLLTEAGYRDAFVVRETGTVSKGEPTLALRGPENLFRVSKTGYLFLPAADLKFLRINGRAYRGVLDISLTKEGRITAVNQLSMEEYLFGVVPAELNPVNYPQQAALEAQAIAARTYALRYMGHRTDGIDLTDNTSMQVYGGASIEKEATNNAVQKTSGIAIYYDGSLIEALYMSTCGGRTEDSSEVFETAPLPYLKSVFCTVENDGPGSMETNLSGTHRLTQVLFADDGTPANRELELAHVLGLVALDQNTQKPIADAADPDEIRRWVERSCILGGKSDKDTTGRQASITSRAGFLSYAAERFFGTHEIDRSISEPDANYYLSNLTDGLRVPASSRHALAFLVQHKLWQPYPDNSIRPDEPIRRCDALTLLVRWILSAKPEILTSATTADPNAAGSGNNPESILAVRRGSRTERLRLAPDAHLFKVSAGRSTPVDRLRIIGNEKLAFHLGSGGEIDFLEVELSATGAASDRFSPVASWQTTMTRAAVAEKLRTMAPNIGELLDLKPARLGASGRVVKLEIIGSRGSVIVNGYQARGKLGLKDTLYTLTRTRADDGSVSSFTFDGRGWGHGVGLCQTGAVGMAMAGRSAEDILKTYYQGVELRKIY